MLAWLGEHADGSEELFRRLAGDGQPPGDPEERSEAGAEGEALGRGQAEDSLTQSEQEARLKLWEAFLERPWFGRTWIIQEVVLAKSLVLHCGPDTLVWERLPPCEKLETFDGIHHLLKSRSHSGYRRGEFRLGQLQNRRRRQMTVPAWIKDNFRHSSSIVRWYTDLSNTIGHLALTFSDWKCTDRRDKIYALLSLEDRTPLQKSIHPDIH